MTHSQPLFQVRHASKQYNGVPALIDAALDLHAGEVHALMGENGAGKSTLIRLLAGVTPADHMEVQVRGQAVTLKSPSDAYTHGLRFIHQELNTVPALSVAENLFLGWRYDTFGGVLVNWQKLNARAAAVLASLGITHIEPRRVMASLSAGDQMLVKIASAFVDEEQSAATVYIMDEPTAALSREEVGKLFAVIERLCHAGRAVLYVSHRMEEVFQIANRVTVMRNGEVIATQPISETTPQTLIYQMTGRELDSAYPPRQAPIGTQTVFEARTLRTRALVSASFTLREGEIFGLGGLTASGRSELLRALCGADPLRMGEMTLNGQPYSPNSPQAAWSAGVAYVPEERRSQGLVLSRSIQNNITLPHLRGVRLHHQAETQQAQQLGETVRLKAQSVQQITRQLSGGNQQKVVFARALAARPRLLLLDEPTRGVDVGAKYDIYALIREASANGCAVVVVSSELPELLGLCDRIGIMRGGTLVEIVSAGGLSAGDLLSLCYGEASHQ